MIIFGVLLIPVVLGIIIKLNELRLKKITVILLNVLLLVISFMYIMLCFTLNIEPFDFNINNFTDYFIYSAVVFVFSPFLWIVLYYYCKKLFRITRVHKNAKIKSNKNYEYYRDDLDKISPSVLMFTETMEIDTKKSISSTILKLKLTGYIREVNNEFRCTDKKDNQLLETERMVLQSIKSNSFDEKSYKQLIEKETLDFKYIRKNNGGKFVKILKILATILMPIIIIISSMIFDKYVFEYYEIYILDNVRYLKINNEEELDKLYNNEIIDVDDYYHSEGTIGERTEVFYSYDLIRADKYEYSIVRKKAILDTLVPLSILISIIMVFVSIYMVIEQIIYFNKNYIRTTKGNELLNKAYALKNYLKDYSLIKNRTEEELILWEYYLVYAVILDVNVKIKDEIIEKYLHNN